MATQLQLRKGTKTENDSFIGAEAELTYDTTTKGIRVHDGTTVGGNIIDTVVFFQAPTADNNYTWARKYASGWVEQGGYISITDSSMTINLLIEMANTNYDLIVFQERNADGTNVPGITAKTVTNFSTNAGGTANGTWEVKGMAA